MVEVPTHSIPRISFFITKSVVSSADIVRRNPRRSTTKELFCFLLPLFVLTVLVFSFSILQAGLRISWIIVWNQINFYFKLKFSTRVKSNLISFVSWIIYGDKSFQSPVSEVNSKALDDLFPPRYPKRCLSSYKIFCKKIIDKKLEL